MPATETAMAEGHAPSSLEVGYPATAPAASPATSTPPTTKATKSNGTAKFTPQHKPGTIIENFNASKLTLVTERADPLYDPRALGKPDPALVEAIKRDGFTSIIEVVERESFDAPGKSELAVVTGRRRTLAAREAGKNVTIRIVANKKDSDLVSSMLVENIVRADYTPMQKSDKFQEFVNAYATEKKVSIAEAKKVLAARLGITVRSVNEHLELQGVILAVRKALDTNRVNLTEVTSRGAGIPQMVTEEGEPDEDRQLKTLEKILEKKEKTGTSTRGTVKSPNATSTGFKPLGKRDAAAIGGTKKVPAGYRAAFLFAAGLISEATFADNASWYANFKRTTEGPGWEPEGEIQDLAEFLEEAKAGGGDEDEDE